MNPNQRRGKTNQRGNSRRGKTHTRETHAEGKPQRANPHREQNHAEEKSTQSENHTRGRIVGLLGLILILKLRTKMEKMNSKIMHVTPSELIKPLPPVIKEIQSPNEYDGKRLTVFIEHTNHTLSIQEPTYEQKAEYRLKGKRLITVVEAQSELSLFWFLFWSNVLLFHFPLWLHFIKFVKF